MADSCMHEPALEHVLIKPSGRDVAVHGHALGPRRSCIKRSSPSAALQSIRNRYSKHQGNALRRRSSGAFKRASLKRGRQRGRGGRSYIHIYTGSR